MTDKGRDALRNLFCPRCSTLASGVLVVFKEGSSWWCGRCVNSWSTDPVKAEAWQAEHRAEMERMWAEDEALKEEAHRQLAEDQEPETDEEREAWAMCTPADGVDGPNLIGEGGCEKHPDEEGECRWCGPVPEPEPVCAVHPAAVGKCEWCDSRAWGVGGG